MTALDKFHRLNTRTTARVVLVATVAYNACAVIAGAVLIVLAWWVPRHYDVPLDGWLALLPWGLMGFGALGIWQGIAGVIAATRAPQAPPPTTPGTW